MVNSVSHKKLYKEVMYLIDTNAFSHKEISVFNYSVTDFYDVLMSELLVNIRLVIENERINNLKSMGVDVCCRVIIEICALLSADKKGEFTDEQKKLFLLQYLGTEIQKQQKHKFIHEELKALLKNPYDQLVNEYKNIIGCNEDEASKIASRYRVFLEYGGKKFNSFNSFIKKYLGSEFSSYREKLNLFIHPSYTEARQFLPSIPELDSKRERIINQVLTLGYQYIENLVSDEYIKTRWNDSVIDEDHLELIEEIETEFTTLFKTFNKRDIWEGTMLTKDSVRLIVFSSIRKLCSVLIDCFLCESLGLNTQVMARAKSFIEMTTMLGVFANSNDIDLDARSFYYTSYMTFCAKEPFLFETIKKVNKGKPLNEEEQAIYNKWIEHFKEWYQKLTEKRPFPVDEETFVRDAPKSLIYYIKPDLEYKYRDLVKEMLNRHIKENFIIGELVCDYDYSARLGHASAYKSKLKENKMFSLIPNLIHYQNCVLDRFSNYEPFAYFVERMSYVRETIEQNKRDSYEQRMTKTYKKMI